MDNLARPATPAPPVDLDQLVRRELARREQRAYLERWVQAVLRASKAPRGQRAHRGQPDPGALRVFLARRAQLAQPVLTAPRDRQARRARLVRPAPPGSTWRWSPSTSASR